MTRPRASNEEAERHVIVCGLGRFGLRIVEHLRDRRIPVVVITENAREDRKARALERGARIVEGDFRFHEARATAEIAHARAMILATASDSVNLEAALEARNESPGARIVMRLDADRVAGRLCADFGIDAALSPPVLAAPAFVQAALDPALPPAASPLVPGAASGEFSKLITARGRTRGPHNIIGFVAACLFMLFLVGVVVFRAELNLTWVDSIYFTSTILTTVGFGDFHLREQPTEVKMFGTLMMFSGVVLIALFTSVLTNFFISGAADQARAERTAGGYRGHVILCGLGSVGAEVAKDLLKRRTHVAIVDTTPDDQHARNLSKRVPLLVGDATDPDVLLRAGLDRARAVIAAVSNDAVNLEIGFIAQSLVQERRPHRPLRIVLRCFDPELARRIHARSDAYTLLSSAEIAAPLFVEKALGQVPSPPAV
jgi:Trk K+ transport system NAD-binding subunit